VRFSCAASSGLIATPTPRLDGGIREFVECHHTHPNAAMFDRISDSVLPPRGTLLVEML
jgi:hypothetical protein